MVRGSGRGLALTLVMALAMAPSACSAPATDASLPEPVRGWPVTTVRVDERELRVVRALDTQQGLRGIADIGQLDGMLFDFDREVDPQAHGFWMRDVRLPLDIAWFDADGRLVGTAAMPLCTQTCPTYHAPAPFRWALETPSGSLELGPVAMLEVGR